MNIWWWRECTKLNTTNSQPKNDQIPTWQNQFRHDYFCILKNKYLNHFGIKAGKYVLFLDAISVIAKLTKRALPNMEIS